MKRGLLKSQGYLDGIILDDQFLTIVGWVAAEDASLTDFIVYTGGSIYRSDSLLVKSGLPSPDVEKLYPSLQQASNARFKIKVPAKLLMNKEAISLVCCIPVFDDRIGKGLFKFYDERIALPPEELIQAGAGGGDFQEVAFEFLDHFIRLAYLKPTERILDIGCGIGRMAYSLAGYLSSVGKYEGFDVVDKSIEWPRQNISTVYPNFRFKKVDIYNKWYNPTGKLRADSFRFPYENNAFDFVFLASVFTHMLPRSVTHYLEEIYRVLDTNGRCLCTAFLINSESQRLIEQGKSALQLVHPYQNHFVKDADVPEETIGYREPILLDIIDKCNFEVVRVEYGSWCGRAQHLSFQDIVILKKKKRRWFQNSKSEYSGSKTIEGEEWLQMQFHPSQARRLYGIPLPDIPPDEVQLRFTGRRTKENLKQAYQFYRFAHEYGLRGFDGATHRILDFGAGWGRIARFFLKDMSPEQIYVADCLSDAIFWLKETKNPCKIVHCDILPPLNVEESGFSLIYAYSVFSHLKEPFLKSWLSYFQRILLPSGRLIITSRGSAFINYLEKRASKKMSAESVLQFLPPIPEVRAKFEAGEFQFYPTGGGGELSPDFYGEAFIPRKYAEYLAGEIGFRLIRFTEEVPHVDQSIIIFEKEGAS